MIEVVISSVVPSVLRYMSAVAMHGLLRGVRGFPSTACHSPTSLSRATA